SDDHPDLHSFPTRRSSDLFSDGDLRRIITDNDGSALRKPIADVMTRNPKRIGADHLASEAMAVMRQFRIDELPVVDDSDKPVGRSEEHTSELQSQSNLVCR